MKYTLKQAQTVLETPTARGRRLATEHGLETVVLELVPGGAIPEHALEIPVAFFVIAGAGRVSVDGVVSEAEAGDYFTVNPRAERSWQNIGAEPLRLLVIKQMNS